MKHIIDKILGATLAVLMAAMTLDVLWGVFSRYVIGHQSSWTDETARFLLIWVGLLGAAYVAGQNLHLAIDLLPQKLGPKNQRRLSLIIDAVIFLFALTVMTAGGARYMYITFKLGQISPALHLPMGYVYAVVPLSGLLIMCYLLARRRTPGMNP